MLSLQENVLIKLQEVLSKKNYSPIAKREIKETLIEASKLDINKEDNGEHLFTIIENLEEIDTFKVNTRKQLMKIKSIRRELSPSTGGYVILADRIVVIVKDSQIKSIIYHELTHITQSDNSYYIPEKYGYSNVFQCAIKEGEAIFNEFELLKKKFPKTYVEISSLSKLYKVLYELYQDMKNLLGVELLDEWKKIDDKEDFFKIANDYTMKHYGINFYSIYNVWSELLNRMILKYNDKDFLSLLKLDSESLELKSNIDEYNKVCSDEVMYNNYINNYKSDIDEIDFKLNNKQILKESYDNALEALRKNLRDYILDNGKDDFALEWQEELDSATIDDYIESLIKEKNDNYEDIKKTKEKLSKSISKKKNLQWVESFLLPVKELSDFELVEVKELGLGCLSRYGKDLGERFNITRGLVMFDDEQIKEMITNNHTK